MPLLLVLVAMAGVGVRARAGAPVERLQALFVNVAESAIFVAPAGLAAPHWFLAVPVARDYDNVRFCKGVAEAACHQPIEYSAQELLSVRGRAEFRLEEARALSAPGTHHLYVTGDAGEPATLDERSVASMPEVVVRRGDDYVGLLSELFGVPFVLRPAPLEDGHQTDLRRGADCAALVVYGQRRLGRPLPYVAPRGLFKLARELPPGAPIRVGDILNFGFQSAVLSVDTPPLGVLNGEDRVIHTYHGLAEETPVSVLPYGSAPFRWLRWPSTAARTGNGPGH